MSWLTTTLRDPAGPVLKLSMLVLYSFSVVEVDAFVFFLLFGFRLDAAADLLRVRFFEEHQWVKVKHASER